MPGRAREGLKRQRLPRRPRADGERRMRAVAPERPQHRDAQDEEGNDADECGAAPVRRVRPLRGMGLHRPHSSHSSPGAAAAVLKPGRVVAHALDASDPAETRARNSIGYRRRTVTRWPGEPIPRGGASPRRFPSAASRIQPWVRGAPPGGGAPDTDSGSLAGWSRPGRATRPAAGAPASGTPPFGTRAPARVVPVRAAAGGFTNHASQQSSLHYLTSPHPPPRSNERTSQPPPATA